MSKPFLACLCFDHNYPLELKPQNFAYDTHSVVIHTHGAKNGRE